jgi:hypothetical protein
MQRRVESSFASMRLHREMMREGMKAMTDTMEHLDQTGEDVFIPEYSDDELEAAVGSPQSFPTFTCSQPMCATGGGCGTWTGN